MRDTADDLRVLVRDNKEILEPSRERLKRNCEPFRKLRHCAKQLHKLLKVVWSYVCQPAHKANIRLEIRDGISNPCFRILFSYTKVPQVSSLPGSIKLSWQDAEFILVDRKRAPPPTPGQENPIKAAATMAVNLAESRSIDKIIMRSSIQLTSPGNIVPQKATLSLGKRKKPVLHNKTVQFEETSAANKSQILENMVEYDKKLIAALSVLPASSSVSESNSAKIENICASLDNCRSMVNRTQLVGCLADDCQQFEVHTHRVPHPQSIPRIGRAQNSGVQPYSPTTKNHQNNASSRLQMKAK